MFFMKKSSEKLTDILNYTQLKKIKVTNKNVQIVKIFQNRNLFIQIVDNRKVEKVQANLNQTQGLGDASIIIKFFDMIAYGVFLYKIDIKNNKAIIRYLTRKNKNTFPKLITSQNDWLKALIGK